jgi:RimJ/RimL family protein N-acetyltransferase
MNAKQPDFLKTSRLILRRPRLKDAEAIFEEYAQDIEVTRYLSWRSHRNLDDTREFLSGCAGRWESGEEFCWVLTLPADERAIGTIACRVKELDAELGYVLAKRMWGRGLMTETARAVADWAGTQESIVRVWATCDIANVRSARVMEKIGMQREGILRRRTVLPNISAEPRDCYAYSRIR